MNVITPDDIDFAAYVRETEVQQKVRNAAVWVQDMIDDLGKVDTSPRAYLPWEKSHRLFQFRPGEVTLWAGVNGHGKSLLTGMAALSLMGQEEKVCIASFEMKPRKSLERMARQFSGYSPNGEWASNPDAADQFRDLFRQFRDWVGNRLWFYDQQGTVAPDQVLAVCRYCAKELGIKHIFVDSLMKCVRGEDDLNGQKNFVDELTSLARDNDVHIHLVHHIRKLGDEGQQPDKTDVKGSGSITDQVDNLLLVWRNKRKELERQSGKKTADEEPDALLICSKQRNGEWEGRIKLWFEPESQQFTGAFGDSALSLYTFPHRGL